MSAGKWARDGGGHGWMDGGKMRGKEKRDQRTGWRLVFFCSETQVTREGDSSAIEKRRKAMLKVSNTFLNEPK